MWTSGFGRIILCPTRCYLAFVRAEFIDGDKLSVNKKRVLEAYKLSLEDEEETEE